MYYYISKNREIISKISFKVKPQHLLKIKSSFKNTNIFSKFNENFAKYHSLSPKLKKNALGRCNNTYFIHQKNSNKMNNMEIEEIKIDNEKYFKEIANGNPDIEKKLKIIEFQINIDREYHFKIPKIIKKEDWEELLTLESKNGRIKYLEFLFKNELETNREKKKLKVQARNYERKELEKEQHIKYGLQNNTLFLRLYEKSLDNLKNLKLLGAYCYSQHIIFDCSYNDYMTKLNSKFCAKQILAAFASNRDHLSPFHLNLCNVNPEDQLMKNLSKTFTEAEYNPLNFTTQSYLDLYPKEKLVYLTPHCQQIIHEYNDDDIYIIGAFVDRGTGGKISLAKAKEHNLRMAKLPLDKYLIWQKGTKSLPLNIVLSIMADVRLYRNWDKAFKNVPKRFLYENVKFNKNKKFS